MRRGSIVTYVDEGRRHSSLTAPDARSNSSGNNNRQEFSVNDIGPESVGGCFVSYRKIAFAFVFFLAFVIAAAFVGVFIGSPPDKDVKNALELLSNEDEIPEKYIIPVSIKPYTYLVKLQPIPEAGKSRVKFKGRVTIDFYQNGNENPSQLMLDSKSLEFKKYSLFARDANENSSPTTTSISENASYSTRRLKQDVNDGMTNTPTRDFETSTTALPSISTSENTSFINGTSRNIVDNDDFTKPRQLQETKIKSEVKIKGNKTDAAAGVYIIFLEKPMDPGGYTLNIEYETVVDERVVFFKNFTKNNETRLLLTSKLKPVNAPRLFPALDAAKLKASFVLTILYQRDTKVLSNTRSMILQESNRRLIMSENSSVTFARTRPMAAHNLAFAVGNFESLGEVSTNEDRRQYIAYWSDPEHRNEEFYLREKLAPITMACKKFFNDVDSIDDRIDIAALPIDFDGSSAPGLIFMRESLFYTSTSSSTSEKIKASLNLINLIGQQWLGGLVNAKNWTDAWFLESSVMYLQYVILDKIDQSLEAIDNFLVDVKFEAMENDGYLIAKALNAKIDKNRVESFDLIDNYRKGACLISMLHAALNESAFRSGYADFLRRWRYGNTDSDEFLRSLAANVTIDGETRLDEILKKWARQPGYPVINVTWDRQNGSILVRQEKFYFDALSNEEKNPSNEDLWWIPLTYATAMSNWSKPTLVWLKGKEEISLDNVASGLDATWIVFNVNRTGYYRVNYDEATWRSLGAALRERTSEFPASTRASLVDDALALARRGSIPYETALDLIEYLGTGERAYAPWRALARHAQRLDFALYETPAYPSFQEFMRNLVSTLFDEMEPKIDQGSPLAMLAVELACNFEYQKCTNWAKNQWEDVFKNNHDKRLMKHVRETVYCIGAQRGGQEELSYLLQKFAEANDADEKDRLLSALGCFQTPWILQEILNEILQVDKYEENDIKVILKSYAKNPAAAQAARRFVQENWNKIVKRFSRSYWTMKAFVEASTNLLSTEHDLNEFNIFRDENIESLKVMGHWVALNEMKAISWIFRLSESSSNIQRWFKNHTSNATL